MRLSIRVLSLGLVAFSSCAPEFKAFRRHVKLPRLEVVPSSIDLGRLDATTDQHLDGEFMMINRGTAQLHITGIQSSCGCTVLHRTVGTTIAPGARTIVRVTVRPRNETGPQNSVVTVTSNDRATPITHIKIQWSEQAAISLEPKAFDLGRIKARGALKLSAKVHLSKSIYESSRNSST
jgi:hypothetical protein